MTPATLAVEGGNIRRKIHSKFGLEVSKLTLLLGLFYMPQICDIGKDGFNFPSEGRSAEDFFFLKNSTVSAGFEPSNLGTKGQHATSRL
jgi:hypothetical protein